MNISGYKIIKQIGVGGMATVYLAIQESLERKVALKVMSPSFAADGVACGRFLREARIIAQLSHPNIIPVYDVGIEDTHYYIAMEYESGGELKSKIKNGITVAESVDIIKQIASALNFAHQNNYIHRDVKPENILFNSHQKALLSDFGVARAADPTLRVTAAGDVIGTPLYMSPEQVQGKEIDHSADIYCLGVIFYEMLTGALPFESDSAVGVAVKHMTEPVPKLESKVKVYQPIIEKMLHKNPDKRWRSGNEIISALEKVTTPDFMPLPPEKKGIATKKTVISKVPTLHSMIDSNNPSLRKSHVSRWKILTWSVVSIAAISTLTGLLWQQYYSNDPSSSKESLITNIEHNTSTSSNEPNVQSQDITPIFSPENPLKISPTEILLEEAQVLLNKSEMTNARTKFEEVLVSDKTNKMAKQGLVDISNHYVDLANKALAEKKLSETENYIKDAIAVAKNNPGINAIELKLTNFKKHLQQKEADLKLQEKQKRAKLKKQREEQKEAERLARVQKQRKADNDRLQLEKKLSDMYSRLNSQLSASPASIDNLAEAHNLFNEVARIDHNSDELPNLRSKLLLAHIDSAKYAVDHQKYDSADFIANLGLKISPKNSELLEIKSNAQSKNRLTRITNTAIAKIDSALNKKPLTLDQLESAYGNYETAINADPNQEKILAKRNDILNAYLDTAKKASSDNNFDLLKQISESGLKLDPQNNTLTDYRKKALEHIQKRKNDTDQPINFTTF